MKVNRTDCDLLSHLPLEIIHIILALIPIREAVRTCILSKQWRYTWTSLPELVFHKECDFTTRSEISKAKYKDLISQVLFRHTGPIHKLKLYGCPILREIPICEDWIYLGIKEIILDSDDSMWQLMHSSIYSCVNLTNLKLHKFKLDPPPLNFKGFLCLKSLNLNWVKFPHDGVGRLVSVCPLLERLTVFNFTETELIINTPNLKYLNLSGHFEKICMHAPLLPEMYVELTPRLLEPEKPQEVCNYMDLLGGLTDVEKLAGSCLFSKYLSIGIDCCHNVLVFPHLKFIDLDNFNFKEAKEISLLSRLLVGAPNLRELRISTNYFIWPYGAYGSEAPHLSFGIAPSYKLEKLRVVTVKHFDGLPMEMELIKILLESSPVLETMRIYSRYVIGTEKQKQQQQHLMDGLMECSFASPVVKLSFPAYTRQSSNTW